MSKIPRWFKHLKRLEIIVRLLELFIIVLAVFITFGQLEDIIQGTTFSLWGIGLLLFAINLVYVILVIREFRSTKIDLNRIVVLIYLIIFCFSLFAGIAVFKNSQPLPILPRLSDGTVGLRSFGCAASFRNIKISYLDSLNIWQSIPYAVVNDSSNWIPNSFISYGKQLPTYHYSYLKGDLTIMLDNNGVIFNTYNPLVSKYFNGAKYFNVSTYVTFLKNYADIDSKYSYPDVQICLNVPLKRGKNNKDWDELYLGFSFPIANINYAKFWIPALEWMVGNQYRDSNSKLKENEFSEYLSLNKEYHLIGVSFFNSARIMLRNDNKNTSSIICESNFEPNK